MVGAALAGCGRAPHHAAEHVDAARDSVRCLRVPGMPPGLASTAFATGFTPGLEAAWISDELHGPASGPDAVVPPPIRFTAIAERTAEGWRVTEVAYSRPLADVQAAGAQPAPPAETGANIVPPEAEGLARQFRSEWTARHAPLFAEREEAVVIGPAGERAFGGEHAREVLRAWWKIGSRLEITRRMHAHVGAGGAIGWASADLQSTRSVEGREVPMPFHVAAAYVRNGTGWRLVQAHVSHAVPAASAMAEASGSGR